MLIMSHLCVHIKFGAGNSLKTGVDLMLTKDQGSLSVTDALRNWKVNFCSVDVLHNVKVWGNLSRFIAYCWHGVQK